MFIGVLIWVSTAMEVTVIGLVFPFIAAVNDPGLVERTSVMRFAYHAVDSATPSAFLELFGATLFGLIVFKNIWFWWVTRLQARFAYGQNVEIGVRLLRRYLAAPYEFHLTRNSADMITTVDRFVELVFTVQVLIPSILFVTESAVVVSILALLFALEFKLTLSLIAVLGGSALLLAYTQRRVLGVLSARAVDYSIRRQQSLQQALGSVKEVKVLGRESFFIDQFRRLQTSFSNTQSEIFTRNQIPRPVLEIVVSGGIVLVLVLVLLQGRASSDVIAVLALFAVGASRVLPGITRILYAYYAVKGGAAMIDKVYLDLTDSQLPDGPAKPSVRPIRFAESVELSNVTFKYRNTERPVVEDFSLRIGRGEAVGLVGASGAGKSTIIDILLGLLTPQSGSVLVDGHDITADPRPWRRIVGYVPQAISLVDDTLRNNVAFGIDPSSIDDQRIWTVLSLVRLDDFVRSLPKGIETMLGERGVRLSGGQRQRVGIARALYHDPSVLVLDEATSALDNQSERDISAAIEALRGEKTLVIVAHRLSTVKRCDRLVLMREGEVGDSGTFAELVVRNADFREMVRLAELTSGDQPDRQPAII
jgi:ATP-binding cassette subfamily C protein